ncbi:MAG: hypothetical protein AAF350_02055 [Pseudomonadota bacterium]
MFPDAFAALQESELGCDPVAIDTEYFVDGALNGAMRLKPHQRQVVSHNRWPVRRVDLSRVLPAGRPNELGFLRCRKFSGQASMRFINRFRRLRMPGQHLQREVQVPVMMRGRAFA